MGATVAVRTFDREYLRVDGIPLLARIYQPEGRGPFPAVVDVHGGQWTKSDRLQSATIHEGLAADGIVVAALDFRMPPVAQYPLPVADINFGIRWFKHHATEFGTHEALVGGLGTSSGGHQLMLNVLRPNDSRYTRIGGDVRSDASLRFVIVGWGVVDPVARYHMAIDRGLSGIVASHNAYFPSLDAMMEANPQRLLSSVAHELPPLLYVQGSADDNLTFDMAHRFVDAYRGAGGHAQLEMFAGEPHTFATKKPDGPAAIRARQLIAEFIRAHATLS